MTLDLTFTKLQNQYNSQVHRDPSLFGLISFYLKENSRKMLIWAFTIVFRCQFRDGVEQIW